MIMDISVELEKYLDHEEKLLWAGQPLQGVRLRPQDALLIPFSIMWGGFAIFWEVSVIAIGAGVFFALWGVPFVLIGLYFMIGRFWGDAWQRARTVYGVTDNRVIIRSGLFSDSLTSLALDTLADVRLTERKDGSGTISFGPTNPWYPWGGIPGWPGMGRYQSPKFDMIPDARDVFNLVRTSQKAAKRVLA